jgi:uncharacterized membrane protein
MLSTGWIILILLGLIFIFLNIFQGFIPVILLFFSPPQREQRNQQENKKKTETKKKFPYSGWRIMIHYNVRNFQIKISKRKN